MVSFPNIYSCELDMLTALLYSKVSDFSVMFVVDESYPSTETSKIPR